MNADKHSLLADATKGTTVASRRDAALGQALMKLLAPLRPLPVRAQYVV
jgi:hypothetical protein